MPYMCFVLVSFFSLCLEKSDIYIQKCIHDTGAFHHEVGNIMLATHLISDMARSDELISRCSQAIVAMYVSSCEIEHS